MPTQAQRDELARPIKDWLRNNPMAGSCNMLNGRRELIAHVTKFYKDNFGKKLTDPQLKIKITKLLNQHRPGIIRPECTRKDCIKKAVGALGASSKEERDMSNKKHSSKRKEVNDLENRKAIEDQGLGHVMRSKTETEELCEYLLNEKKYAILDDMTMSQAIQTNSFTIYIGTTKRALTEEDLRWLTERGAQDQGVTRSGLVRYKGRRNRPVLLNEDGTCITMGEARSEYGAKSVFISRSRLRLNETDLEDALQTKLQPELLGLERLHRYTAMGDKQAAKASEEMKDPNFLAKAFMTCLPVTGFDESSFDGNKRKPKWVEFNNKRAKVNY
jgi:hypothetical protein